MEFLYLLEKIRFPLLNEIMLAITLLGDEMGDYDDTFARKALERVLAEG